MPQHQPPSNQPNIPSGQNRPLQSLPTGWTPDDGYSPGRIYGAAADSDGHSKEIHVEIPKDFHARLTAIVNRDDTPWRSVAEMVRDSLFHRSHWFNDTSSLPEEFKEATSEVLARLMVIRDIAKEKDGLIFVKWIMEEISDIFNRAQALGRPKEWITSKLEQFQDPIDKLPEEDNKRINEHIRSLIG